MTTPEARGRARVRIIGGSIGHGTQSHPHPVTTRPPLREVVGGGMPEYC